MLHPLIQEYNQAQNESDQEICELLASIILKSLPKAENKIWHGHPVWFLEANPIVGYHKLKNNVRVLFWSGQSFSTEGLTAEGSFKAAECRYKSVKEIDKKRLKAWLKESESIQWDYKNIVKRKGKLERLK